MNDDIYIPKRPKSILWVSLLSLFLAVFQAITFFGNVKYILRDVDFSFKSFFTLLDLMISSIFDSNWPWGSRLLVLKHFLNLVLPFIEFLILLYLASAIYFGLQSGRSGFIVISAWKIIYYPILRNTFSLETVIILMFALWYFRQPIILDYFILDKISYPKILQKEIGKIPIDLAILIILTVFYIFVFIFSLQYYLPLIRDLIS